MDPLQNSPADPQPDLAHLLPREAFHEIILILRAALPPPVSDDPADEVRRDRAAMAAVAALQPANGAEGRLAAQFVAADAWAMDCLLLAGERKREFEVARKCRAQAMSLMREGKSALRVLLRMQAARRAVEGDEEAAGRAAWAEHAAVAMMAEALAVAPAVPDAGRVGEAPSSDLRARASQGVDGRHKAGHGGGWSEPVAACGENVSWGGMNPDGVRRETEPRPWLPSVPAGS